MTPNIIVPKTKVFYYHTPSFANDILILLKIFKFVIIFIEAKEVVKFSHEQAVKLTVRIILLLM